LGKKLAKGKTGGSLEADSTLEEHLDTLEEAVGEWLRTQYYFKSSPERQRLLRRKGIVFSAKAEMPEPYRLWQMHVNYSALWWDGGLSAQPYIMMLELATCANAYAAWQEEQQNMENILHANK